MSTDLVDKTGIPAIRTINLDACEAYYSNIFNVPLEIKNKSEEFDKHFSNIMPPNLDLLFLHRKGKLSLKHLQNEYYTFDIVNVIFNHTLLVNENNERVFKKSEARKDKGSFSLAEMRKELYLNGFVLNGKKYVRYKRSSGAAKSGSCLFIKESLFAMMDKWSKTGLDVKKDTACYKNLTSYEAYKALSLSSLIQVFDLNPYNILFVDDFETYVKNEKVVKVSYDKENGLTAKEENCDIKNNIFDGEGLLDTSVFLELGYKQKGMMLLRNRFFKCCAFQTKLKDWFKYKKITSIDQLNGFTFAKSIDDIVLVTSKSCLKYVKMCKEGFTKEGIKRWCDSITNENHLSTFGVVKTDKNSRFFDGDMVETTYQLLNTLQMKKNDVIMLTKPYIEYIDSIKDIKNTPEFFRFYLEGELNYSEDDYDDDSEGTFAEEIEEYSNYSFKNKVCLDLMKIDSRVRQTKLFKNIAYDTLMDGFALKFYNGRTLVDGTYATLFGNPYEFLNYIILDKDGKPLFSEENKKSLLGKNEVYTPFFKDGAEILGSRAPHTAIGNILVATNRYLPLVRKWFILSRNIIVVDAINNNIQHRLSGCDYDSDSLLITNNEILLKCAKKDYENFPVPYAGFSPDDCSKKVMSKLSDNSKENLNLNLNEIDNLIAHNNVGAIVNLSQLMNSHLWNKLHANKKANVKELYSKIALLSALSGAEIDSSKRTFPFSTTDEYQKIKKYAKEMGFYEVKPLFYSNISNKNNKKLKRGDIETIIDDGGGVSTTMDILWKYIKTLSISEHHLPVLTLFNLIKFGFSTKGISKNVYNQVDKAIDDLIDLNTTIFKKQISQRYANNYDLMKNDFNFEIGRCLSNIKLNINTIDKVKLMVHRIEEEKYKLEDRNRDVHVSSNTLLYFLLYIISIGKNILGYSLSSLFPEDAKGIPTLRRHTGVGKYQYTIFDRYHYAIDEVDVLVSTIFHKNY